MTTRSLSLLGVTASWFDRFAEIPTLLQTVYEEGAAEKTGVAPTAVDWNAVYQLPKRGRM